MVEGKEDVVLVRIVCKTEECLSSGKWYASSDCAVRGGEPMAVRGACVDSGMVLTVSSRVKDRASPFFLPVVYRVGIPSPTSRRDPVAVCREVRVASPWVIEIRRAPKLQLRQGFLRIMKHLPPSNLSGLEDLPNQRAEVSSAGTRG